MSKPIIGIVAKFYKEVEFYNWTWNNFSNPLRYALSKNGANVLGIFPQTDNLMFQEADEHDETIISDEEKNDIIKFIKLCDGVVLQGGLYSAYYEEFIAKYCYDNDIPLLGICAGFNTIIRALGGTTLKLPDHLHDRPDLTYAHGCTITDENSKFYSIVKTKNLKVNSIHTYIADNVPDCLSIVAKSDDDQVEVIESKDKTFLMGIKYHPELLCDLENCQNDIFVEFISKAKSKMLNR